LLERLKYEEEDLIFETKSELFSIGTIIISYEIISLLSISVSKFIISGKSDPDQGISIQKIIEVVFSTINTIEFHVKLDISLEDKVYP
jgi:hypothetical protein